MPRIRINPRAASDVTEETLRSGPVRLVTFLQGVADPAIRALLVANGWSNARCAEGFGLVAELAAFSMTPVQSAHDDLATAITLCRALHAGAVVRARVLLALDCPAQGTFLFHDYAERMGPSEGLQLVLGIEALAARIHQLKDGTGRAESREADRRALALLADAGLGDDVVANVERAIAASRVDHGPTLEEQKERHESQLARMQLLRRIYAWLATWSTVARTAITRRDQLIRLGIAKRRPRVFRTPGETAPTARA